MKKVGLVGGLGPASTVDYYLGLIERGRTQCGPDIYPEIVIDSVNMNEHAKALLAKDYDTLSGLLIESINNLKAAGAEVAAITANTEHIVWDMVCEQFTLPVVNILDAVVQKVKDCKYSKVLVFGTEFTMRSGMYENVFQNNGITAIIPTDEDIAIIGKLIYPNLENGIVIPEDRQKMIKLAEQYITKYHVDAMLLGCTEIPLVIKPGDVSVPTLNSTEIHIDEIFRKAREVR